MKTHQPIRIALILGLALISAQAFAASSQFFPPVNQTSCATGGAQYMQWTEGSVGTSCVSGQDIFHNALPTCVVGQYVAFSGGAYICKTIPTCSPNELLSFNGTNFECRATTMPTCSNGQVLTFNGSAYNCVSQTETLPTCGPNQILTYNGSYQCVTARSHTLPVCGAGQALTSDGANFICGAIPASAGESHSNTCTQIWMPKTGSGGMTAWKAVATSSDATKVYALGWPTATTSYIYRSTDGGETWTRTSAPLSTGSVLTQLGWGSIATSADGATVIAGQSAANAYSAGIVYTSADAGVTWTQRRTNIGATAGWESVAISSDGMKMAAAGSPSFIYISADKGATWAQRATNRTWSAVAMSADGSRMVASARSAYNASTGDYVYLSANSGATWTAQTPLGQRDWASVAVNSDGTKIAVAADDGTFYVSTNSGANWALRSIPKPIAGTNSVKWSADGSILSALLGNMFYISKDSGATWAAQSPAVYGLAMNGDGSKYFGGSNSGGSDYVYATQCATSNDCAMPWGGYTESGSVINAYDVTCNGSTTLSCNMEGRVCSNGQLTGSYSHSSCACP